MNFYFLFRVALPADHVSQGTWAGINLAMATVNIAEVAGDKLPLDTKAEIYTLAAITIRLFFPTKFHFLAVSCSRASAYLETCTFCSTFSI